MDHVLRELFAYDLDDIKYFWSVSQADGANFGRNQSSFRLAVGSIACHLRHLAGRILFLRLWYRPQENT